MELRHLESFVAAAEVGSLSGASKRCHLSQPALSQQMRALEEELGEQLLVRRPRGVDLTAAGDLLLGHAKGLMERVAALKGDFESRRELQSGNLEFGIIPTMAPFLIPGLLAPFRNSHPGVVVSVTEARTSELIRLVSRGEIEFAILSDVTVEERKRWSLQVRELFREPLLLAAPADHALAKKKAAPVPADLREAGLIHLSGGHCLSDRTLRLCNLKNPEKRLECDQLATALAMVAGGMGVSVVPALATKGVTIPNVVFRRFAGKGLYRVISLMKRRGAHVSAAASRLLELFEVPGMEGEG